MDNSVAKEKQERAVQSFFLTNAVITIRDESRGSGRIVAVIFFFQNTFLGQYSIYK